MTHIVDIAHLSFLEGFDPETERKYLSNGHLFAILQEEIKTKEIDIIKKSREALDYFKIYDDQERLSSPCLSKKESQRINEETGKTEYRVCNVYLQTTNCFAIFLLLLSVSLLTFYAYQNSNSEDQEGTNQDAALSLILFLLFSGFLSCCISQPLTNKLEDYLGQLAKRRAKLKHEREMVKVQAYISNLSNFEDAPVKMKSFVEGLGAVNLSQPTLRKILEFSNLKQLNKLQKYLGADKFNHLIKEHLSEEIKYCLDFLNTSCQTSDDLISGIGQLRQMILQDPSIWEEIYNLTDPELINATDCKRILIDLGKDLMAYYKDIPHWVNKIGKILNQLNIEGEKWITLKLKTEVKVHITPKINSKILEQYKYFKAFLQWDKNAKFEIPLSESEIPAFEYFLNFIENKNIPLNEEIAPDLLELSERLEIEDCHAKCYEYLVQIQEKFETIVLLKLFFDHANKIDLHIKNNKKLLQRKLQEFAKNLDLKNVLSLSSLAESHQYYDVIEEMFEELKQQKDWEKDPEWHDLICKYSSVCDSLLIFKFKEALSKLNFPLLKQMLHLMSRLQKHQVINCADQEIVSQIGTILNHPELFRLIFEYPLENAKQQAEKIILDHLILPTDTISALELTRGTRVNDQVAKYTAENLDRHSKMFRKIWDYATEANCEILLEACTKFFKEQEDRTQLNIQWTKETFPRPLFSIMMEKEK